MQNNICFSYMIPLNVKRLTGTVLYIHVQCTAQFTWVDTNFETIRENFVNFPSISRNNHEISYPIQQYTLEQKSIGSLNFNLNFETFHKQIT
jgi:hypothetical protein